MKNSFLKTIFALVFLLAPFVTFAGSEHNMSGYAWSDTIGWISFNCTNNASCSTSDYGVTKNDDGTLTGFAWSDNIGWIQFGNLSVSGFPAGTGTQSINAKVNGTNLQGWARACAGMSDIVSNAGYPNQSVPNNTCTGVSRTDGWDGWISLSGSGYGVNFNNNTFSSYAWGSDVVYWIDFAGVGYGVIVGQPVAKPDLTASVATPATATKDVAQNFTSVITNGGSESATGTITHLFQYDNDSDHNTGVTVNTVTTSGTIYSGGGSITISDSHTFATAGTRYVRVCADNNLTGPSDTGSAGTVTESNEGNNCSTTWRDVNVVDPASAIGVTLTANPSGPLYAPGSTQLTWTATGLPTTCVSSSNPVSSLWHSTWTSSYGLTGTGASDTIQNLTTAGSPYTFTITCSKNTTEVSSTVVVTVLTPGVGQCSSPQIHYTCSTPGASTNRVSSPSRWTWRCPGSPGQQQSDLCTENKGPGYIEG